MKNFALVTMKFVLLCTLLVASTLLVSGSWSARITEEEGVLVLGKSNFDGALKAHPNLLVHFHAPWCGHCKELVPEYAKAARMLKDEGSDIHLGTVDAEMETEMVQEFEVHQYPTILFFKGGEKESHREYRGGRQAYDIVKWLKIRTGPAVATLADVAQAESMIANEVAVIGFFKDAQSEDAKAFVKAAEAADEIPFEFDDIPFGMTSDDAVYSKLGMSKDGVVLFKTFDEGHNTFDGELTEANLLAFIKANELPLVTEFLPQTIYKIFGGEIKPHIVMFTSKAASDFGDKMDQFKKAAEGLKGKILFVFVDTDKNDDKVMQHFGLKKEQCPTIRLFTWDEMEDNTFDGELTEANLLAFIKANELPLVTEFLPQTIYKIFGGEIKPHIVMFTSKAASDFGDKMDQFKKAAEGLKGKILFVFVDTDKNDDKVMRRFGLKKEQCPTIRLFTWDEMEDGMRWYQPEDEAITAHNIICYCTQFIEGKFEIINGHDEL